MTPDTEAVMETTILLVDDHPIFRKGLRHLIEEERDMSVVGEAGNGGDAIALARKLLPDVVIMDITMPDLSGIEATRQILSELPETKVMALSVHSGTRFVQDMLQAGAFGYILKESIPEEMIEGIRTVRAGEVYLSRSIAGVVVSEYRRLVSETDVETEIPPEPILRTKLHRPSVDPNILARPRLLKQIDRGRSMLLTLVSAPAGYGKTTLASRWLEVCDCPSAWISLDESDNSLRSFLQYFLAGIRTVFPAACQESQDFLGSPLLPPPSVLARTLANGLDNLDEDFILVLDDYHHIRKTSIHDLMTELLRHPPPSMHLVLLTRRDPPLPLAKMRARGQVNEIAMEELRFATSETAAFLQKNFEVPVDDATVAIIEEKLEGWVTGLRLLTLSLKDHEGLDLLLSGFQEGLGHVTDYLVAEVISRQPPVMADYMTQTAILNRFCSALCDAIHAEKGEPEENETDGEAFVEWLRKAHMFVVPLDEQDRWFRYHHLFQDLLQNQLRRKYTAEDIAALHSRASAWFAENRLIDEAIEHAVAGGDVIGAAQLVEQSRQAVLNSDRWFVLDRWLAMFPETAIQQRPRLLLARAWALYHHFDIPAIPAVLDAVESLLKEQGEEQSLRGEIDFFRGYIYYFQNKGSESLKSLDDALKRLPVTHHEIRSQTEILHGLASQMQGKEEEAINRLNHLLHHHEATPNVGTTRLLVTLVYIYIISGDLNDAPLPNQQLYDVAEKADFIYAKAWSVYLQGLIHFYENDLASAIEHFRQAVEQRHTLHTRAAIDSMAGLACSYQAMRQPDLANKTMQLLLDYVDTLDDPMSSMIAHSCHARLSIMQGNLNAATSRLQEIAPPGENMVWWLEIPAITHCRVLLARETEASLQEAEEKLRAHLDLNKANHNTCHMIQIMPLLALAYKKQDRTDEALTILEEAVVMAEPGGWIRPFVELGPAMAEMLQRLRKQSIAADFIERLLAAFSDDEPATVEDVSGREPPPAPSAGLQPLIEPLTNRELDVLELLARRLQNKEIAEKLFITTETVKGHVKNIFQKLGAQNRRDAVEKAKQIRIL